MQNVPPVPATASSAPKGGVCGPCAENPKSTITYAWISLSFLTLICFIVGCVEANRRSGNDDALSFTAVWTVLVMVFILVIGTYIFRKSQTQLSVGYLLGVIVMMANQCLIMTAVFGSRRESAATAFAVFCFFIFMGYTAFAILLGTFRDDIIKKEEVQATGTTATNPGSLPAASKPAAPPTAV